MSIICDTISQICENNIFSSDKSHYGELPKGWAVCRLSQLATFAGGKTPSTSNNAFWNGTVNWVTSKDMKSKYIYSTQIQMSGLGAADMQLFPADTLLMVVRSGILRRTLPLAILKANSTVNQDLKAISFYLDAICEFVYYYLTATESEILTQYQKDGTTVESIDFERFRDIKLPLPPLAEQYRIVDVIESAFALIDEIELYKCNLLSAVTAAKSKILSLAISGKLVPQDENDEPASVLLERIQTERTALASKGKAKKPAATPTAITADSYHYEQLPLGEVCYLINTTEINAGNLPYLDVKYLRGKSNVVFKPSGRLVKRGTPLILVDGENSGEVFTATETGYMGSTFRELLVNPAYDFEFVLLAIKLYQKELRENKTGSAIPHLNKKMFSELPLPLMPITKQTQTVNVVNNYFAVLDSIASNLN